MTAHLFFRVKLADPAGPVEQAVDWAPPPAGVSIARRRRGEFLVKRKN